MIVYLCPYGFATDAAVVLPPGGPLCPVAASR
jgi:hypothetical protein